MLGKASPRNRHPTDSSDPGQLSAQCRTCTFPRTTNIGSATQWVSASISTHPHGVPRTCTRSQVSAARLEVMLWGKHSRATVLPEDTLWSTCSECHPGKTSILRKRKKVRFVNKCTIAFNHITAHNHHPIDIPKARLKYLVHCALLATGSVFLATGIPMFSISGSRRSAIPAMTLSSILEVWLDRVCLARSTTSRVMKGGNKCAFYGHRFE